MLSTHEGHRDARMPSDRRSGTIRAIRRRRRRRWPGGARSRRAPSATCGCRRRSVTRISPVECGCARVADRGDGARLVLDHHRRRRRGRCRRWRRCTGWRPPPISTSQLESNGLRGRSTSRHAGEVPLLVVRRHDDRNPGHAVSHRHHEVMRSCCRTARDSIRSVGWRESLRADRVTGGRAVVVSERST